jgi:hypothetical protein
MSKTEKSLLALWFILNIIIGLFIVRDFGVSYDEPDYYLYAKNTVDAYRSFFALAYRLSLDQTFRIMVLHLSSSPN